MHVHIICAAPAAPEWRQRLTEWQWGNSFYLNEEGVDPDEFTKNVIAFLEPNICIFQTPTQVALDPSCKNCSELYLDFTGANIPGWSAVLAHQGRLSDTKVRILHTSREVFMASRSIVASQSCPTIELPMVDFETNVRLGCSLAIVCGNQVNWSSVIDVLAKDLTSFIHWNGKIEVYMTQRPSPPNDNQYVSSYQLSAADDIPSASNRFRVCIYLDPDPVLAMDFTAGLLNHGVPILQLADGSTSLEPREIACSTMALLRQHVQLVFSSDRIAYRYAAVSCERARFKHALSGLTYWCRQLGLRLQRDVDNCLRAEAA